MKRFLFFAAATAVALSSCSKNEVVETPDALKSQIGFSTYVGTTTKAELVAPGTEAGSGQANFATFYVSAYHTESTAFESMTSAPTLYFSEEQVNYSSEAWASASTLYWPGTDNLSFFAYGSDKGSSISSVTYADAGYGEGVTYPTLTFVTTGDNGKGGYEDLVVAYNTDETVSTNSDANLAFSHALTKLQFAFNGESTSESVTYTITNVSFTGVLPTGKYTYDATTPTWEVSGEATTYNYYTDGTGVDFTGDNDGDYTISTAAALMLIPQDLTDIKISVTYSVEQSGFKLFSDITKTVELSSSTATWTAASNLLYTLTLPVSADATEITFTSTSFTEWGNTPAGTDITAVEKTVVTVTPASNDDAGLSGAITSLNTTYASSDDVERTFYIDATSVVLSGTATAVALSDSCNFVDGDTIIITFSSDTYAGHAPTISGDNLTISKSQDDAVVTYTVSNN